MKKIIIFTLLLLLTTLPSTAKGIKTHMDRMWQHGGARSAIPSVMIDQESAYGDCRNKSLLWRVRNLPL